MTQKPSYEVADPATRLRDGPIPAMEVSLRHDRVDNAIRRLATEQFLDVLPAWLEAAVAMPHLLRSDGNDVDCWKRGDFAPLDATKQDAVIQLVEDSLLSFGIAALTSGKSDSLSELARKTRCRLQEIVPSVDNLISDMSGEQVCRPGERNLAMCLFTLTSSTSVPMDVFEASLRIAFHLERSNHRRVVLPLFARWLKHEWLRIAATQRFALRSPTTTTPNIIKAAGVPGETLQEVGMLLQAAAVGVAVPLAEEIRIGLRRMARGE